MKFNLGTADLPKGALLSEDLQARWNPFMKDAIKEQYKNISLSETPHHNLQATIKLATEFKMGFQYCCFAFSFILSKGNLWWYNCVS